MRSREDREGWRLRIRSAEDRYEAAKMRVAETAIERLTLPVPDGSFAHTHALRDEMLALKAREESSGAVPPTDRVITIPQTDSSLSAQAPLQSRTR
jgi:hypothetical protein